MTVTVEAMQAFFDRYRKAKMVLDEEIVSDFMTRFRSLVDELAPLLEERRCEEIQFAPRFNLFSLFRIDHYEVTTHSTLLADLLDPGGTHGQGRRFLDTFFETLAAYRPGNLTLPERRDVDDWTVRRELVTYEGNLDLVLSSVTAGWMLVIENKICAGDQTDQLKRYWRWLQGQKQVFPGKVLAYLTLEGRDASSANGVAYARLSYRIHISDWIRRAFAGLTAEAPRVVLQQYLKLLQSL